MSNPVNWVQRKFAGLANWLCTILTSYTVPEKVIWSPTRYSQRPESPSRSQVIVGGMTVMKTGKRYLTQ